MKNFVEYVCSFLVKDQESLSINQIDLEERIVLELSVKESDLGRVIGKEGRVAKAMRTLLSIGNKENQKPYYLEIIE